MADYFTKFSIIIPLSPDQIEYAVSLYKLSRELNEESGFDALPEDLRNGGLDGDYLSGLSWDCHQQKDGIWLDSYEGGIDSVATFIAHLLEHFNDDGAVVFEYSNDCSKPRTDAYGGGAVRVTRTGYEAVNSSQQVYEWTKNIEPRNSL